jgi:hypothetical protein
VAVPKNFLWDTIEQLASELERFDPASIVAARCRGLLMIREMSPMTGDRHPRSKSAEEDDRIASLYLAGGSLESAALEVARSTEFVKKALARRDIAPRKIGAAQSSGLKLKNVGRIERIRQMRAEGKTLEEIGTAEKVTRERVRQICVRNGIDTSADGRPLRPEEQAAVDDYVAGESLNTVSEQHGFTLTKLKDLILRSGNTVRQTRRIPGHTPETLARAERAAQLYAEGKTTDAIGEAIGTHPDISPSGDRWRQAKSSANYTAEGGSIMSPRPHPIAAANSQGCDPAGRPGPRVYRLHSVKPIAPAMLGRIMNPFDDEQEGVGELLEDWRASAWLILLIAPCRGSC